MLETVRVPVPDGAVLACREEHCDAPGKDTTEASARGLRAIEV